MARNKLLLITIFVLLIFTTFVSAEVTDIKLVANNNEITAISTAHAIRADVELTVTDDIIHHIVANISDFVKIPSRKIQYENMYVPFGSCYKLNESDPYTCRINNVIINPASANLNFSFKIYNTSTNYTNSTLSKSFTLDSDSPVLENIRTDYFADNKSFMRSGGSKLYFEFNDANENFNRKQVFYTLGSSSTARPMNECDAGVCWAYITKTCGSGQSELIKLNTAYSEDDAGNPVESDIEKKIYCDNTVPFNDFIGTNKSWIEIVPNSDYGLVLGGKALEINAYAYEDGPVLEAEANFSSLGGDFQRISCVKQETDNLFKCNFQISSLTNAHLEENIAFTFYDVVNNTNSAEKIVSVLKNDDASETPEYFEINSGDVTPKEINRIALDLAQTGSLAYPIYAGYEVIRKNNGAYLNHQVIDDCVIEFSNGSTMPSPNLFDNIEIAHPYEDAGDNYLDLVINSLSPNAAENIELVCNFSLFVSDDETYYNDPLIVQGSWPIKFFNSAFDRPGKAYTKKITEFEDSDWRTLQQVIYYLNKVAATLSELCGIKMQLNKLQSTAVGVKLIEKAASYVDGALAELPSLGIKLGNINLNLGDKEKTMTAEADDAAQAQLEKGKKKASDQVFNFLEQACVLTSCGMQNYLEEEKNNNSFTSSFGWDYSKENDQGGALKFSADEWGSEYKDQIFSNIGKPDLYNSLIGSISLKCWPGVLYNINKYSDAQCEKIYCYKRNAQYGMGVATCEESYNIFMCKNIVGEVFELPYFRDITNIADNINNLAQNFVPQTLSNVASSALCRQEYKKAVEAKAGTTIEDISIPHMVLCEIPLSVGRMIKSQRTTNRAAAFQYPNNPDICAMAFCNEEDPKDCEHNTGFLSEWTNNWWGLSVDPTSIINTITAEEQMNQLQTMRRNSPSSNPIYGTSSAEATNNFLIAGDKYEAATTDEEKTKWLNVMHENGEFLKYDCGVDVNYPTDLDDPDSFQGETNNMVNDVYDSWKRAVAPADGITPVATSETLLSGVGDDNYGLDAANSDLNYQSKFDEYVNLANKDVDYSDNPVFKSEKAATFMGMASGDSVLSTESIGKNSRTLISRQQATEKDRKERDNMLNAFETDLKSNVPYSFENSVCTGDISSNECQDMWKTQVDLDIFQETEIANLETVEDVKNLQYDVDKEIENLNALGVLSEEQKTKLKSLKVDKELLDKAVDDDGKLNEKKLETYKDEQTNNFLSSKGLNSSQISKIKEADEDFKTESKEKITKLKQNKKKLEKAEKIQDQIATTRKWVDFAMKYVWNLWLKDLASLESLNAKWSQAFESISSESIKNSICNPEHAVIGDVEPGTALDCTGISCRSVMSMAIEKAAYNWTVPDNVSYTERNEDNIDHYIYTLVYYIGPVKKDYKFNAYLVKTNNDKVYLYRDNETGEPKQIALSPAGQGFIDNSVSFVTDNNYKKFCIEFNKNFPGVESGTAKHKYCRNIVDFTNSQFQTGEPDKKFGTELDNDANSDVGAFYE